MGLGTATLGESGAAPFSGRMRAMWQGRLSQPPLSLSPVQPATISPSIEGVARAPWGSALAVSLPDDTQRGYWGEVLTTAAESAGIVALVIEGTVRDLSALERHRFPVFALRCRPARRHQDRTGLDWRAHRARRRDCGHRRLASGRC